MKRAHMKTFAAVLLVAVSAGCNRSPEARRDKYLARGKEFLNKQDYSRAILEFRNAAKAMPKDAEAYYQIGLAASATGDFRTAVNGFRLALAQNPKHSGAQLKLAQMMTASGDQQLLKDAEGRLHELLEGADRSPETLNTLALTELKLGKTENAAQTLEQVLARLPGELNSSVMLAQARLLQNDVQGAEAILKKASESAPKSMDAIIMLGRFYTSRKRFADAEQQFERALALDPNNAAALWNLATLQNAAGRKQEAERTFKRVAALPDKRYKPAYAAFLFQEERQDEAVKECERLAAENPDDRIARTRLVAAYRAANRPAEARAILEKALKKNPKDQEALLQRGEIFIQAQKYAEAEMDLNAVLHLSPNSAEIHYILGKLHKARGTDLLYREDLSRALELNPYLLPVRLELAQALIDGGAAKAALQLLSAAPESQRQATALLVQRGWALWAMADMAEMRKAIDAGLLRERSTDLLLQDGLWKLRAGNFSAARSALDEALKMNPADLRALAALKQTYDAQKQGPQAVKKIKEYAAGQPHSAGVQEFLGVLLMANGDRQQARAAFEAAKAADPKFVRADLSLVQNDILDGKFDDAQHRLEALLGQNRENTLARLWLGNIQASKGNYKAALAEFGEVVAAEPGNAQALNNFAYLLAETANDPIRALKYAQMAKELAPQEAAYSDTLGWILYRRGLYSQAIAELERATSKAPNATWRYHLAMAYAKAGDPKRGRAALEAALKQNPNLPEAKMAQEMLGAAK